MSNHLCFGFEGIPSSRPFQLRVKFGGERVSCQLQMASVLLPPAFRGSGATAGFTCVDYRHVTGRVYTPPPAALAHRAAHGIRGFTHNTEAAHAYKNVLRRGKGVCLVPPPPSRRTRIAVQALEVCAAPPRECGKLTVAAHVAIALYVLWESEDQGPISMRLEFRSV